MKCYGCGQDYDPLVKVERVKHQSHFGDTGLSRSRLLTMLDECQAERDAQYLRAEEVKP